MLHFISFHAPDVLKKDRPDERSVEAPLEKIAQAIESVRNQNLNILGRKIEGDKVYISYYFDGAIFVLCDGIPALRLISDSHESLSNVSKNLSLPYSTEKTFPFNYWLMY